MHKIIFVALCSGVVLTPPLATPSLLSFSPPTTTPTGLNFSLSPLANGIIYIFLRSYCDLFHFSVPRLQYRPVRLNSQDTPRGGRIMDLDRGSITSVVSRISGRGQVRHGRVLCCFDKKNHRYQLRALVWTMTMTMYLKSQQRFLTFSFFNNCIILAQVPVVPARARLGVTTRSMRSQQEFP